MDNRDRDKLSQGSHSTSAGNVNRNTSSNIGSDKSGSSAEFGQKIGRSENKMNEPSGRSSGSSSYSGSSSENGSSKVSGSKSSNLGNKSSNIGSSGDLGRGSKGGSRQ